MAMELYGVSKETHLLRSLEANEMVEKFASNFVHTRKTKPEL
jgi:hypothetical protein